MSQPDRFADRVAVVTGAASGIGAASAERLAREGAAVVLTDISPGGEETGKLIAEAGGRASFVRADVADEQDWARVIDAAHAYGPVDILVSNAYASDVRAAHETTRASWDRQLAVTLTGAFLGVRAVLPDMRERGGSVVLVSSVHARFGLPAHPAYAAAKAALIGLCGQLAVEYAPLVRVNALLPGPIMTPAWDSIGETDRTADRRGHSRGQIRHRGGGGGGDRLPGQRGGLVHHRDEPGRRRRLVRRQGLGLIPGIRRKIRDMSLYGNRGVHGQTVDAIGRRVLSGELAEDETLDLTALQAEFGVSLTVMRESLKVLAAKGLVGARQKRGTYRAAAGGLEPA